MSESKDELERRTDDAFARSGWADPRPGFRALLRRVRENDAAAFERAVGEYETRVVQRLADGAGDPVAAWLDYGRTLAQFAGGGRTMRIDADGRAEEAPDSTEPALLLHMSADPSAPAFVVAAPREPSAAQRASVALLAEGATALSR